MAIEALEGVTDQDLFNAANADDDAVETVTEPAEETVEQEQPAPEPTAATPEPPAKEQVDDNAAMVPSWRVREINEEKRALAEKVAAYEAEKFQWQRQQQPAPQPQRAQEMGFKTVPLLDPDGYAKAVRDEIREEMLADRRETSLLNARKTYKEEFDEAYAAATKAVDPALKARMHASRDPGETLMEWHREQKTRAEVGNDLNAFRQREQERLLSDPAFLAKAVEKARAAAQPQSQPGGKSPSPVSLPPSLTRATNASADINADDNDVSDEGLWRHANA